MNVIYLNTGGVRYFSCPYFNDRNYIIKPDPFNKYPGKVAIAPLNDTTEKQPL